MRKSATTVRPLSLLLFFFASNESTTSAFSTIHQLAPICSMDVATDRSGDREDERSKISPSGGGKQEACRNDVGSRRVSIRSAPWCQGSHEGDLYGSGDGSILPLQMYSGIMERPLYADWLRTPLDHIDVFGVEDDPAVGVAGREGGGESHVSLWTTPNPLKHILPIYVDAHIIVLFKPSGVLSVPGPKRNPSLADLVFRYFGNDSENVDKMVVHRLDMSTSGVLAFARTDDALKRLHIDFRDRKVKKRYQALLCGHLPVAEGSIELPLRRDGRNPPFMCVSTPITDQWENLSSIQAEDSMKCNGGKCHGDAAPIAARKADSGFVKMMSKAAKPSVTEFRVLAWEHIEGLPVTRVELVPITGR